MAIAHNLGFPRIGTKRNMKKAVEHYWQGELDCAGLMRVGQALRAQKARRLTFKDWIANSSREFCEVDIIDVNRSNEIESSWKEFFFRLHYKITNDIWRSYLFKHPRRSCDAFASATLVVTRWDDYPFPRFATSKELQSWVRPLIEKEEVYQKTGTPFSGKPLSPNVEKPL